MCCLALLLQKETTVFCYKADEKLFDKPKNSFSEQQFFVEKLLLEKACSPILLEKVAFHLLQKVVIDFTIKSQQKHYIFILYLK